MENLSVDVLLINLMLATLALIIMIFINTKYGNIDLGMLFFKKLNKKAKINLDDYNYNRFSDIRDYLLMSSLSYRNIEGILPHVLCMFENAQSEEKSIDTVIGNDHKKFCDDILKKYEGNFKIFYRILKYIENLIIQMLYFIFFIIAAESISKWNFIYALKHSIIYSEIIYIVYYVLILDVINHKKIKI